MDHLPLEEVTIAEVLKEQGYICGFIGKWHLAGEGSIYTSDGIVDARYQPENQGFDVNIGGCAYGQPKSYFDPYKNGTIEDRKEGEYLTDRLGDEAVKFISENKDRPFFLDLSTYAVHTPLRAPAETIEKYGGNTYFAMIEKLDQIETHTDEQQTILRSALFEIEKTLDPVDAIFLYDVISLTGEVADMAERVGRRLELLLSH